MQKVTKSLIHKRSVSEDAFFRSKDGSFKPREKGVMHRGLIGAEGTAPFSPTGGENREIMFQKEGATRRLRHSRMGSSTANNSSLLETTKETPAQEVRPSGAPLKPSFGKSKSKDFSIEEAMAPNLGKPIVFGDLGVITEAVPASYM